jgi:predicted transcriptional regulator
VQNARAARAMTNLSQRQLAEASGVGQQTIKSSEGGSVDPRVSTLQALKDTLEARGVVFLSDGENRDGGPGVRVRGK